MSDLIFNGKKSDFMVLLFGWRDGWFDDFVFLMKRWMILLKCILDEEMSDFMVLLFGWRDEWFYGFIVLDEEIDDFVVLLFGWRDWWFCGFIEKCIFKDSNCEINFVRLR